jgi:diadenosine tetraphosphate (Ap4A) HIT family hydrolase
VNCDLCERNAQIDRGEDDLAVARLSTGYVKLMPNQYFRGSTFFQAKSCVPELHALALDERAQFMHEMVEVSEAMWRVFAPRKLNYELLGNSCPHLRWFLIPRYDTDPHPRGPAWEDPNFLRLLWTDQGRLPPAERDDLRARLLAELRAADVEIKLSFF